LPGFLQCALETRWQRYGQFLNDFLNDSSFPNDFLYENLNFFYENLNFFYENIAFLYENLRFSLLTILMIFSMMIFLMIHKIFYYKVRVGNPLFVESRYVPFTPKQPETWTLAFSEIWTCPISTQTDSAMHFF